LVLHSVLNSVLLHTKLLVVKYYIRNYESVAVEPRDQFTIFLGIESETKVSYRRKQCQFWLGIAGLFQILLAASLSERSLLGARLTIAERQCFTLQPPPYGKWLSPLFWSKELWTGDHEHNDENDKELRQRHASPRMRKTARTKRAMARIAPGKSLAIEFVPMARSGLLPCPHESVHPINRLYGRLATLGNAK
jgi:hypothetical protein